MTFSSLSNNALTFDNPKCGPGSQGSQIHFYVQVGNIDNDNGKYGCRNFISFGNFINHLFSACADQMLVKITLGSIYEIVISDKYLVLRQINGNNAIEVHVSVLCRICKNSLGTI